LSRFGLVERSGGVGLRGAIGNVNADNRRLVVVNRNSASLDDVARVVSIAIQGDTDRKIFQK
jgi:hypothetical protein